MHITIILPISRHDYLSQIFSSLELLHCDRNQTSLLAIVDGDDSLYTKARNFVNNSKFNERLCVFRNQGEVDVSSIMKRRERIAAIHNEAKKYIHKTDFIFLVEDDTLYEPLTLVKLQTAYSIYPYAGFISAVQVGRWGLRYIGLWHVDNIYKPIRITSSPLLQSIQKVDASGFYCLLTKKENYIKHNFTQFEGVLGPDFEYGLRLRQKGFANYGHFGIYCTHLTKKEKIQVINIEQVTFEKIKGDWCQII